jgi:hypothetical protein
MNKVATIIVRKAGLAAARFFHDVQDMEIVLIKALVGLDGRAHSSLAGV